MAWRGPALIQDVTVSNIGPDQVSKGVNNLSAETVLVVGSRFEGDIADDLDGGTVVSTAYRPGSVAATVGYDLQLGEGAAPAAAADPGLNREVRADDDFLYVKTPGGDWKKAALVALV